MKIHRFFLNQGIESGRLRVSDAQLFHQLKNVLRLSEGSKVVVVGSNSREALAEIKTLKDGLIEFELQAIQLVDREPTREVTLYCSLLKKGNFEIVVQKATEIGVKKIFPVLADRTVKLNFNMERLQKIIKEAAEQSGRVTLPAIFEPAGLADLMRHSRENQLNWFLDISGSSLKDNLPIAVDRLGVFIGPEGGWSSRELAIAGANGLKVINFGKLTLRAETAAIVAAYIAVNF